MAVYMRMRLTELMSTIKNKRDVDSVIWDSVIPAITEVQTPFFFVFHFTAQLFSAFHSRFMTPAFINPTFPLTMCDLKAGNNGP